MRYTSRRKEPVTATLSEVGRHLASAIDRACRKHTPTLITQRGRRVAVLLDSDECLCLLAVEQAAEDAWLGRLAAEAEEEGREGPSPRGRWHGNCSGRRGEPPDPGHTRAPGVPGGGRTPGARADLRRR
ncbi:type II toxin-antitoxin system Phd/YefM family antitoxin [Nocardiopsis deserti]|uniref:type II toxin-antitoxin system Phd/YefM family antitoxin n=1 Tax=Nocardiopsis deserti TaxID=2605988 RepID=UPI001CC251B4|nr:type II toxin-antitoxin system Phd/YefM family antitoxin [Nocardiopsis deserti]